MKLGKISVTITPTCLKVSEKLGFYDAEKGELDIPIGLIFLSAFAITIAVLKVMGGLNA